jgi:NADP-reducing hydrogenase subunit HndB
MDKIKSLDELKKIREEALKKREARKIGGQKQIIVGMGTVGIASGARETLKAILNFIAEKEPGDIVVRQTGNIGMDSYEPIVQVVIGDEAPVSYGKVTPEIAIQIMQEHVVRGKILDQYVIKASAH